MPLTDIEIKKSKPASRPYKKFDGGGLHLFITPNGSKLVTVRSAVPVTVQAIAGTAPYLLSLPNNASVAELLINSRLEASI